MATATATGPPGGGSMMGNSVSGRKRPEDEAHHITVSDPVQHSEGMNKYTSYRVDVRGDIGGGGSPSGGGSNEAPLRSNNPNTTNPPTSTTTSAAAAAAASNTTNYFQNPNHTAVLRRYSDFLWLYERLQKERPGAILPPLPEKQAVARFGAAFVEDRRFHLELFLRRVAVHPEVCDAPSVKVFLRADDVAFHAAKRGATLTDETGAPGDLGVGGGDEFYHAQPSMAASAGASAFGLPPSATAAAASPTRKKKEGIKQWFAETKTTTLISMGLSDGMVHSPDDDLFVEIETYVHQLDTQMKHVLTQTSALVRKGKEVANGLFEFGLAFQLLGQSESADDGTTAANRPPSTAVAGVGVGPSMDPAAAAVGGQPPSTVVVQPSTGGLQPNTNTNTPIAGLGAALGKMGGAADALSILAAELSELEEAQFERPLKDYIRTIAAVRTALSKRAERRLTYTTALSELNAKQVAADRVRGVPGREDKAYQAEKSLRKAQVVADAAREDFAAVSQRILREVDRFKREKAEDMRCTVMDYINLQIEYSERMERVWGELIPQLERIQSGSEGVEGGAEGSVVSGGGGAGPGSVTSGGGAGGTPDMIGV